MLYFTVVKVPGKSEYVKPRASGISYTIEDARKSARAILERIPHSVVKVSDSNGKLYPLS